MRYRSMLVMAALSSLLLSQAQKPSKSEINSDTRADLDLMLENARDVVRDNYFDKTLHGLDWDARYKLFKERVDAEPTLGAAYRDIAGFLSGLHDSHTYFEPPAFRVAFYYGFQLQMIGNTCYITRVRPGTDAAAKLHPGDQVLKLNGYNVTRGDIEPLEEDLYGLEPHAQVQLELRAPDGQQRTETIITKFLDRGQGILVNGFGADWDAMQKNWNAAGKSSVVNDVYVWQLPSFVQIGHALSAGMKAAEPHPAMVLDLRGNPGGRLDGMAELTGYFFPNKIEIAENAGRDKPKPVMDQPQHDQYTGKLVILVDSRSASAAEMFARFMQIQHRAQVVGDVSAGAVRAAYIYGFGLLEPGAGYGIAVAVADVRMPDGKGLEGIGVTPDVVVLPTGEDMAAGRDPAMAKAVELAGGHISSEDAGKLFPYKWPPFDLPDYMLGRARPDAAH